MIDHTGIIASDFERSKEFYRQTLAPIGYELIVEFPATVTGKADVAGFGEAGKPDFWVIGGTPNKPPVHVAFRVGNRAIVDAFHKTGLASGAGDNGAPGLRPHYHPDYYAAFLLDPDGHNVEAVCHEA
ncbi:MAG: VOC family protein [Phyllobacterium sp.]